MKMSTSTGFQLGSYGYSKIKRSITKEDKHLLSVVSYSLHAEPAVLLIVIRYMYKMSIQALGVYD